MVSIRLCLWIYDNLDDVDYDDNDNEIDETDDDDDYVAIAAGIL